MVFILLYLVSLSVIALALIGVFVFVVSTLREVKDEDLIKADFLQENIALFSKNIGLLTEAEIQVPDDFISSKVGIEMTLGERRFSANSVLRTEETDAERFTIGYFRQYGVGGIVFPRQCTVCGHKTTPQILKWEALSKIPALESAHAAKDAGVNNLWTVVGKCSACKEKYILAMHGNDGFPGNLEWVLLQPDNYDRLISFDRRKISKEKLGFILRTLPDRSLVASESAGEWIWLTGENRSYI